MAQHNELGQLGEQLAANFLQANGYNILARNWRVNRVEIDIIAELNDTLIFVEVKTRETDYFGYPEEAVGKAKQKQLQKAADAFVDATPIDGEIRFDIVAVILNAKKQEIHHIEDAFWPMEF